MIYDVVRSVLQLIGGTTGPASRQLSVIRAIINGDNAVGGVPATGGGGGGGELDFSDPDNSALIAVISF